MGRLSHLYHLEGSSDLLLGDFDVCPYVTMLMEVDP